jgi:endonuclease/exonuclease/phosphatase family metal-dependent hydrolase
MSWCCNQADVSVGASGKVGNTMIGIRTAVALGTILAMAGAAQAAETTLTVMAYNIWGGGANEQKPVDETVAAIKAAGADIVAVSETRQESDPCTADSCPPAGPSVAAKLAEALGFHYYDQTASNPAIWANAIISRYPIVKPTKDDLGVAVDVDGRMVYVFCVNLDDAPYQPYQLLNIEYGNAPFFKTADEAIKSAEETRGKAFDALIGDANEATDAAAVFIAGDFNEPSHRDWTDATIKAGLQPVAVAWPGTTKLERPALRTLSVRSIRIPPPSPASPGHRPPKPPTPKTITTASTSSSQGRPDWK